MKSIILFLLYFTVFGVCDDIESRAVIPKIVDSVSESIISKEDIRKTIEHIQRIAHEQQNELEKATIENNRIKSELTLAKVSQEEAQQSADSLQKEVNDLTDDRNTQAKLKNAALTDRDYWKKKDGEAIGLLWKWRFISFGLILLIAGYIYLKKFSPFGPIISKFI